MTSRRKFITQSALASAAIASNPFQSLNAQNRITQEGPKGLARTPINFPDNNGIGGVAFGNGFHQNTNEAITETLQAAWDSGVRYFDTSPWYGLGLSERRLGHFLFQKKREDFLLSTKVGRVIV